MLAEAPDPMLPSPEMLGPNVLVYFVPLRVIFLGLPELSPLPGRLKQQKCIISQPWRPDVGEQGISRVGFS